MPGRCANHRALEGYTHGNDKTQIAIDGGAPAQRYPDDPEAQIRAFPHRGQTPQIDGLTDPFIADC